MTTETPVFHLDIEKPATISETVARLRRLADALEAEKSFVIQIAGERITVPPYASVEFEYERSKGEEELEIEFRWRKPMEHDT